MVSHEDMEMTINEGRRFYIHKPLEEGGMQSHIGSTRASQEAEGVEKMWARAFIVVSTGRYR